MLKALIGKQLLELFQGYFVDKKTGKARSRKGTILYFGFLALLFIILGFTFYGMASGLGAVVLGKEINWLYFAVMGVLAIALGVFGSVLNTYSALYLPKDNDFLFSLPIPPKTLLLARTFNVYLTALMYSGWIWIPVMLAFRSYVHSGLVTVLCQILLLFVIALFVSVLSCILGWVVALIASKTKGKSWLTVILSLIFLGLYYVIYFRISNSFSEIIARLETLETTLRSRIGYLYLLGKGADGDLPSLLLFTVITLILAGICFLILLGSFTKLANSDGNHVQKAVSKDACTQKPVRKALLDREFLHFTSVSSWMLNGGLGLVILVVAALVMIFRLGEIRGLISELASELPMWIAALPVLLLSLTCLITATNMISPVSISIERNTLWIIQSLPIDSRNILQAKESMDIRLNLPPVVIFVIVAGIVLELKAWEILLVMLGAVIFICLSADFGLILNLKNPNFNWTNVTAVTKQSMPVAITLFGGWIFCGLLAIGGFLLSNMISIPLILAGYVLLLFILWILLHKWLVTKGAELLASL